MELINNVQIPVKLRSRPRWRGYPITFVTLCDEAGIPDFKIVDHTAIDRCARERLCGLCGQRLKEKDLIVFIGGPECVEQSAFIDPGMHVDCAVYAAKVCPFLCDPDATYSKADPKQLGKDDVVIKVHEAVIPKRSDKMALYYTRGFDVVQDWGRGPALIFRPWSAVKLDWETIPERRSE